MQCWPLVKDRVTLEVDAEFTALEPTTAVIDFVVRYAYCFCSSNLRSSAFRYYRTTPMLFGTRQFSESKIGQQGARWQTFLRCRAQPAPARQPR